MILRICESSPLLSNILFMIVTRKKHYINLQKPILFLQNDVFGSEVNVFEKLEQYVQQQKPSAIIKEVNSDGLCVVRSFQEGLRLCYNIEVKLSDVLDGLRSEILNNHSFYAAFFSNNLNFLCELDMFLKDPLKYYKCETWIFLYMPLKTLKTVE